MPSIEARIAVFGATRAAAAIEWSKAFCHEVAAAAGVRMARAMVCTSRSEADRAVTAIAAAGSGVVVKEDGLAAGKGVTVLEPGADPSALLDDLYARDPAARIVIEERLYGAEASVIAVCDGERAIALPAARDHKRLGDGDTGPNTGGMGAYSPLPDLTDADVEGILADVHRPILAELARRGTPFRGFLYAGLMLTADGPVLLECNARLGDPETQVMLPRLGGALGPVLLAAARGSLPADLPARLPVLPGAAVGIVLAGEALPGRAESRRADHRDRGGAAPGRARLPRRDRAATAGGWTTNGGRILTVVGRGADLAAARSVAERAADAIAFPGLQRRHDIGAAPRRGARPMIPRYTLPEMGAIWSEAARFEAMLRVELAVARAQAARGQIPPDALVALETRSHVDVDRILEIERTTDHDVIAFVSQVAEAVGPEGRYLHLGPDQQRRRRHRARAPAPRGRRAAAPRLRPAARRAHRPRPRRGRHRDDGPDPLGPRRADDARAQARRLGVRARARTGPPGHRRRRDRDRQDLRTGRHVQPPRTGHRGGGARRRSGSTPTRSAPRSSSATAMPRS